MQFFSLICKNYLTIIVLSLSIISSSSAQEVKKLDPYNVTYEKNVLLVKFRDEADVTKRLSKSAGIVNTGIASVDKLYSKYQIQEMEQVFKGVKPQLKKQLFKDSKGQVHEVPALDKIYKLKFKSEADAKDLTKEFSKDENIEYAEPDYHFSILAKYPDDPLYTSKDQWYIDAVHAPEAWEVTTGDTTQIIAILDTGVDWEHPDLINKIWHNWKEIPGNGIDDDGNGYVDDFIGWDFINRDNNPKDDNSHGTHVAGIAAAESNNGVGITGIAWGSKVMPIKILQSSGQGNGSDIAEGVYYAAKNGATVINMSFGSYGESITIKSALEYAYSKAVLVAAAGNDHLPIIEEGIPSASMYPACYPWVIGVQASGRVGGLAGFSNYDPSGPVEFWNSYGHNYEITAPGEGIYSTFPNNGYRYLSGTSMAAPIVSGAVALMKSHIPSQSTEEIFARLIQSSANGILNIRNALDYQLHSDLHYVNYTIVDTLVGCDKDGRADAGETIELYLTVKNAGGKADSVQAKLRIGEFEDKTVATIIDSTSYIGSISAYGTLTGKLNPFKIKINSNVVNNRDIVFHYEVTGKDCIPILGQITITSQKGYQVGGLISSNQEWTSDKEYLVVDNIRVAENATLKIDPGTIIKLEPEKSIEIRGSLKMQGTKDNMITLTSSDPNKPGTGLVLNTYSDSSFVEYVKMSFLKKFIEQSSYTYGYNIIRNCIIKDCGTYDPIYINYNNILFDKNIFTRNKWHSLQINSNFYETYLNNVFINNEYNGSNNYGALIYTYTVYANPLGKLINNSFYNNKTYSDKIYTNTIMVNGTASFIDLSNNYWGSTNKSKIDNSICDFYENATYPIAIYTPFLNRPSSSAHGHVWKVLINGKDSQEEILDPIASEKVKFEVYFNRAMDTKVIPFLSFGVREPYTQRVVIDSSSWNPDSTIWTAYYNVGLETGDGINMIRVANAEDNENFEIPIEDSRFKFVIQAAGAKSTEFIAKADIGKVQLEWPAIKKDDMLGYNMYRYMMINDSTKSETVKINNQLFTDSTYTDYSVTPNKTYYYQYSVIGTDFKESDYSKAIAATPLSAKNGDANGDMSVNVIDITTIVNYLLNKNPQPFIFDAADVNDDGNVNVLDIVSAVNIIMGHSIAAKTTSSSNSLAVLSSNGIDLKGMNNVSAIQMKISGKDLQDAKIIAGDMLKRMEYGYKIENDTLYFVAFNLRGGSFNNTDGQLFRISKGKLQNVKEAMASNTSGNKVDLEITDVQSIIPKDYSLEQNYPNPFNPTTTIRYGLPEKQDVEVIIYNILGQKVNSFIFNEQSAGYHEVVWNSKNDFGSTVSSGIYIYQIKAGKFKSQKKMMLIK